MNCQELIQYLSDYIDQGLSEELHADAQEHLATCHNCSVVLNTTERTILLYRAVGQQIIPAQRRTVLFDQIQSAFEKRCQASNPETPHPE
jgi:adenosyl cobinamide kinase/adenosyl cobinamide phosphate guanylyltransferase